MVVYFTLKEMVGHSKSVIVWVNNSQRVADHYPQPKGNGGHPKG